MSEDPSPTALSDAPDTAAAALGDLCAAAGRQRRAEADLLAAALRWALLHPAEGGSPTSSDAATFTEDGQCEPISGPGCPGVAEWSVPEFAAALGVDGTHAKRLLGDAVQLSHRLPRLWRRVQSGDVDVSQARAVAATTVRSVPALTAEAADWVDQRVAAMVGRIASAQVERTLEEAFAQFGLAVQADEPAADDPRHVAITPDGEAFAGLARVSALVDLADARDLEQALAAGASALTGWGAEASPGARRAAALGHLARRQTAIELGEGAARRVDLTLHFSASSDGAGAVQISPTGRLGTHEQVLLEQVRAWSRGSHTEVRVRPLVHAATADETSGCMFPWCGDQSSALADEALDGEPSLCAVHEEVASHGWSVDDLGAGRTVWRSPHGLAYVRDPRQGTVVATVRD